MKRLLLVTYDFPPVGGVGVQRVVKLVKYLPENGIEPIVLTNAHALSAPKPTDPSLLDAEYLRETKIIRKGGDKLARYHRYKTTRDKTLYPYLLYLGIKNVWFMDIFKEWFDSCKPMLETIASDFEFDCILTTSPPHSVHFFGDWLSNKLRIPWIMDLRDSMTIRVNRLPGITSRIQMHAEARFERRFVERAARILTVSEPMKSNLILRNGSHLSTKVSVLPNGFDPDDFGDAEDRESDFSDKSFVVTYTGTLIGRITPLLFVDALETLVRRKAVDGNLLVVRFVGEFDERTTSCIRRLEGFTNLQLKEFVPHADAVRMQETSDLLLLITAPGKDEYAAEIITGKVFEYMAAKRPIFALTTPGPLKDIVSKGFGYTAAPDDVDNIAATFQNIFEDWQSGRLRYSPNPELLRRHDRREQAAELADIVRTLAPRG